MTTPKKAIKGVTREDAASAQPAPAGKEGAEEALFAAIAGLNTAEEVRRFLIDLCTRQEVQDMAERWLLARLLDQDRFSYREISAMTGASTTTIGRVSRFLAQEPHQGYRLALDRLKDGAAGPG